MKGEVYAISVSDKKGEKKVNVKEVFLKKNWGIENDAHAGIWHRQVSLLSYESIISFSKNKMKIEPGNFAENITTRGIELSNLSVGDKIGIGKKALIEITQIGKECHTRCNIYYTMGDCIMPRLGLFAKVIEGGIIKKGDNIALYEK